MPPMSSQPHSAASFKPQRPRNQPSTSATTRAMRHDAALADIYFVNPSLGWAVGDRGVIWHTDDGGSTWRQQASPVSCNLSAVFFVDNKRGWAVGGESQLGTRGHARRRAPHRRRRRNLDTNPAARLAAAKRREILRPRTRHRVRRLCILLIHPAFLPRATAATPGSHCPPTQPATGSPAISSIPISAPSPAPPAKSPRWPRRKLVHSPLANVVAAFRFAQCASSRQPVAGPSATADSC